MQVSSCCVDFFDRGVVESVNMIGKEGYLIDLGQVIISRAGEDGKEEDVVDFNSGFGESLKKRT